MRFFRRKDKNSDEEFIKLGTDILNQVKYETAPGLCVRASQLASAGQPEQALPLFREALAIDPLYGFGWSDLGRCLLDLDRPDEATPVLVRASELKPDDLVTWRNLGEAYVRQWKFQDARRCLDQCRRLSRDDELTLWLERVIDDLGRRYEADKRSGPN
jgi:tetratricopeptide (TPR) repeat protein